MPRSGIREVMDLVWQADAPVIGLHVGEPSFPVPSEALQGAHEALDAGHTSYVPNAGIPELREAIGDKLRTHNSIQASADDIIVTAGGMQALSLAMLAVLWPGDEVLVPDPGWPNFAMAAQLLNCLPRPYRLSPENEFLPTVEELDRQLTSKTRLLILNTPSNPLGSVFDERTIVQVLEWAVKNDLWVISDECYDAITFEHPHLSPAAFDTTGRVLSCFSFSKTYSMTGMRVGYVLAPEGTGPVLAKMQEPVLSCVNAPAQYAALAALRHASGSILRARQSYQERRDAACHLLDELGVSYLLPRGSFFLWVDVHRFTDSASDFARRAVLEKQVAVAPGTAFGSAGEGYIRVSLATETHLLLEGLTRIFKGL
ncbi:pyridoxal phosphate-dependent aminotransferase [Nesterenkonia ebinurensis]|uniref:pyridoxal phosphate-dependent aminotransferase n=1 Tax=Nesterenkonia ebinurensis TaxID=2608252 RepID=UPI00123CC14C|nr:pyridoxal phosphate-dependent aminotransferase [Nesterenkonia ebinurensis]